MEGNVIGLDALSLQTDGIVVEEDDSELVPYGEGALRDMLAAEGIPFETTTADLIRLLKDEKLLKNPCIRKFLISESVLIAVYATQSGPSLINNDYKATPNPPVSPTSISVLRRQWEINDYIFCKFLLFILENSNVFFDIEEFNRPRYKASLGFLTNNIIHDSSLVLDNQYNLLYDYIKTIKDTMLVGWMILTTRVCDGDEYLRRIVNKYGKKFEITNSYRYYYQYYSLVEQRVKDPSEVCLRFPAFLDPITASAEGFTISDEQASHNDQIATDETVLSFDINQDGSLAVPSLVSNIPKRHEILAKTLGLQKISSPLLLLQFRNLCGLIDPLTQPLPNDKHIISIDFLYQLLLGSMFSEIEEELTHIEGLDWKFHFCFNMQKIIKRSMVRLNFDDFEKLNSINNSDESIDWRSQLKTWLPHGFNTQNLELLYMVDILAVYSIYKAYDHLPIQLNPFLSALISLWKNLTCVILLGLEIDRIEEEHETFDTPLLVRATIRGATALRAVVAAVLNGHVETYQHDFLHESINTFMSPYGRKLCQGSLYADLKSHAGAILALGTELEDVTELLADLQAGDRFDEDVRYMFEYEYDDFHDDQFKGTDPKKESTSVTGDNEDKNFRQRRCNCIFDDDVMEHEGDYENSNEVRCENGERLKQDEFEPHMNILSTGKPHAVRHPNSFEFDYSGKDWRDIPRGENFYYSEKYEFIENPNVEQIISLTLKAATTKLEYEEGLLLLRCVASCVKNEQDGLVLGNLLEAKYTNDDIKGRNAENKTGSNDVQPDDIYDLWCLEGTFEKMLQRNPHISWRLMDEMLVCSGYRRVLIWFITHMQLNFPLIEYIYELVMGLRGGPSTKASLQNDLSAGASNVTANEQTSLFPFSRQGLIHLSYIETKMLMQEFFTNAAISLSEKSKEPNSEHVDEEEVEISLYDVELMKLICAMVRTLISEKKYDFTESESAFELQALLMNWLTIIPEARSLFFDLKTIITEMNTDSHESESLVKEKAAISENSTRHDETDKFYSKDFEHNRRLMNLLPLPLKGSDANVENAAVQTLRDFIKRYPFTSTAPGMGRRVIYEDGQILPQPVADRALDLHNYLLEFDEIYKSEYISEEKSPGQHSEL